MRKVAIELLDADSEVVAVFPSVSQLKSLTHYHLFALGLEPAMGAPGSVAHFNAMPPLYLQPGESIRLTDTDAVDPAGDQFAIRLSIENRTT